MYYMPSRKCAAGGITETVMGEKGKCAKVDGGLHSRKSREHSEQKWPIQKHAFMFGMRGWKKAIKEVKTPQDT